MKNVCAADAERVSTIMWKFKTGGRRKTLAPFGWTAIFNRTHIMCMKSILNAPDANEEDTIEVEVITSNRAAVPSKRDQLQVL